MTSALGSSDAPLETGATNNERTYERTSCVLGVTLPDALGRTEGRSRHVLPSVTHFCHRHEPRTRSRASRIAHHNAGATTHNMNATHTTFLIVNSRLTKKLLNLARQNFRVCLDTELLVLVKQLLR